MSVPTPQAELFLKELEASKNVSAAARAAGFRQRQPLYTLRDRDHTFRARWDAAVGREPPPAPPGERIPVELLTPEQRRLVRQLLASMEADPMGTVQARAREALDAWLQRRPWPPLTQAVADELQRISPRAFEDYSAATSVDASEKRAAGE